VYKQIRERYKVWHHEHTFNEREGQTVCQDDVVYAALGGPLVNRYFWGAGCETDF
jgi:ligand-binding SRPBCC domain-containing protein